MMEIQPKNKQEIRQFEDNSKDVIGHNLPDL